MKHSPANSKAQRDRFVLSGGHGSMLLYSLLHLSGYNVSLDDLRAFRQVGSNIPVTPSMGTPMELRLQPDLLGQGVANAVGMAIAERMAAAQFNRPGLRSWTISPMCWRAMVISWKASVLKPRPWPVISS